MFPLIPVTDSQLYFLEIYIYLINYSKLAVCKHIAMYITAPGYNADKS